MLIRKMSLISKNVRQFEISKKCAKNGYISKYSTIILKNQIIRNGTEFLKKFQVI